MQVAACSNLHRLWNTLCLCSPVRRELTWFTYASSLSCVSGISACHFQTCQSLDKLNFGSQAGHLWALAGSPIRNHQNSLHNACMLILSNPFLEFCISILAFSSIILLHMFVQAFDNWNIENSRALLWNWRCSENSDCLSLCKHFFSCYAFFTWIWTNKTHGLTDYQLTVGSFL